MNMTTQLLLVEDDPAIAHRTQASASWKKICPGCSVAFIAAAMRLVILVMDWGWPLSRRTVEV